MNRDDIIEKVFPHSLFGYDPVAVDAFLDEVIREFDRMTNTIDVLQFRMSQELGEARQTNDILSARLSRTEFNDRVEQLLSAGHIEPEQTEPTQTEPEQTEPAQTEPAQTEPVTEVPDREAVSEPPAAEAPAEKLPKEAPAGEKPEAAEPKPDDAEELAVPVFEPEEEDIGTAAEEIRLMTRREIKKMVREEKALERRVRREKKKEKK